MSHNFVAPQSPAWQAALEEAHPLLPSVDWEFLGFDVCDEGFLSGVTNCGYPALSSLSNARAKWSHLLNDHHLFYEEEAALEFKTKTNLRVTEHAPFYAIGLWLLGGTKDNRIALPR
jgi:hypothetical protein